MHLQKFMAAKALKKFAPFFKKKQIKNVSPSQGQGWGWWLTPIFVTEKSLVPRGFVRVRFSQVYLFSEHPSQKFFFQKLLKCQHCCFTSTGKGIEEAYDDDRFQLQCEEIEILLSGGVHFLFSEESLCTTGEVTERIRDDMGLRWISSTSQRSIKLESADLAPSCFPHCHSIPSPDIDTQNKTKVEWIHMELSQAELTREIKFGYSTPEQHYLPPPLNISLDNIFFSNFWLSWF